MLRLTRYLLDTLTQHICEELECLFIKKKDRVFNTKGCSKLTMLHSSNKMHVCTIDTKGV